MSDEKKTIERSTIKPERLYKAPDFGFSEVKYKEWKPSIWVRFKYRTKQVWNVTKKISTLAAKHPKQTFILISTFMKIKTNQTSTKAGIALLITILGLFGIQVNPELFTEHLTTIIEGVIAVFGAMTGLWAIFKDDEEELS
jgi:hypothetical protein